MDSWKMNWVEKEGQTWLAAKRLKTYSYSINDSDKKQQKQKAQKSVP